MRRAFHSAMASNLRQNARGAHSSSVKSRYTSKVFLISAMLSHGECLPLMKLSELFCSDSMWLIRYLRFLLLICYCQVCACMHVTIL